MHTRVTEPGALPYQYCLCRYSQPDSIFSWSKPSRLSDSSSSKWTAFHMQVAEHPFITGLVWPCSVWGKLCSWQKKCCMTAGTGQTVQVHLRALPVRWTSRHLLPPAAPAMDPQKVIRSSAAASCGLMLVHPFMQGEQHAIQHAASCCSHSVICNP